MARIALLAAVIALLPGSRPARALEYFCPECWSFRVAFDEIDSHANCLRCVKPLVAVEALSRKWAWCAVNRRWADAHCDRDAALKCCTDFESRGTRRKEGETTATALYCPRCRTFGDPRHSLFLSERCLACLRPQVKVLAVTRSWSWCPEAWRWRTEPCPANEQEPCCTVRTGTLLVLAPLDIHSPIGRNP